MDFVEVLLKVSGKTVILVVVDRFFKYVYFIVLSYFYTAVSVVQAFFRDIVRLYGISEIIVLDRDKVFRSIFWRELFRFMGINLCFTTVYRSQFDGQTEVVNRTLEMYFRCVTGDELRQWFVWFFWIEYCYNIFYYISFKDILFRMVYGRELFRFLDYVIGSFKVEVVDVELERRDEFLTVVRERLMEVQNRMKVVYDKYYRVVEFNIGDWVWLKLYFYR